MLLLGEGGGLFRSILPERNPVAADARDEHDEEEDGEEEDEIGEEGEEEALPHI